MRVPIVGRYTAKFKTLTDADHFYYELLLGIKDNALVRQFWCKSRLWRKYRIWPAAKCSGKHHLEITITYKLGEQLVSATYKMDLEVKEAVWSKTISGLIGPTGSLPIHPVGMDVNASVRHHGKIYTLARKKLL